MGIMWSGTEMLDSPPLKKVSLVALIILHIIPIWIFKFFPSQDGPCHLYNAYVLKSLLTEQAPLLQEYYTLNLSPFPNWASHVILPALMFVVSPLVAEKLLLSSIICLFPLSLFYFLGSVNKEKKIYGYLGFLFSYNLMLHLGFLSFSLSVPLFFFALGYFWKHKDNLTRGRIAVLTLLAVCIYFCHIISYGLLLLSITLLTVTTCYRTPQKIGKLLIYLSPLFLILLSYLLSSTAGATRTHWGAHQLLDYFLNNKSLVYYTDAHLVITRILTALVFLLFAVTVYMKIRHGKLFVSNDQFLVLFCTLLAVYCIVPWRLGAGWLLNDRVHIFLVPVLLPFLFEHYSRTIKGALIALFIFLSLAHVSISCYYYHHLNKGLDEFTSAAHLIEKNKTVLVLSSDWWNYTVDVHYVEAFVQAANYYCMNNGCVNLGNYEAKFEYFPINWRKRHTGAIDYIITWKLKDNIIMSSDDVDKTHGLDLHTLKKELDTDYELIYSTNKNLNLYQHKTRGTNPHN